ncbi:MAG: hypothetical protein K0Q73_9232 [Paenibacillus sp.]|nr:hypothetical protein [Paenibacillus sp.]
MEEFEAFTMQLLPSMKAHPELLYSGDWFREMFAYDMFIETWNKQGGDQIIQEATVWYNKNM